MTRTRSGLVVQPDGRLIGAKAVVPTEKPPPLGISASWWRSYQGSLATLAAEARDAAIWARCLRSVRKIETARPKKKPRTGVMLTLPGEARFDAKAIVQRVIDNRGMTAAAVAIYTDPLRTSTKADSWRIFVNNRRRAKGTHRANPPAYEGARGRGIVVDLDAGSITARGRPVVGVEVGPDGFSLVASAAPARVDSDREAFALRALDVIDRLAEDLRAAS